MKAWRKWIERTFSITLELEAMQSHYAVVDSGQREALFSHCIINSWNSLPQDVVSVISIEGFKRGLANFMEGRSIKDY